MRKSVHKASSKCQRKSTFEATRKGKFHIRHNSIFANSSIESLFSTFELMKITIPRLNMKQKIRHSDHGFIGKNFENDNRTPFTICPYLS